MEGPYVINDDIEIIKKQIAAGDQKAFRALFNLYVTPLVRFAQTILKEKTASIEVVDMVFAKLWRQKEAIENIHNLKVYLYTSVKNAALNQLAQKERSSVTIPLDVDNLQWVTEADPEKQMISAEIMKKITAAIDSLPPRCKMIFKLVREDGLKYREVAEILNLSSKTVDAQMVIAIRRISEQVQSNFDFFPKNGIRKN